MKKNNLSEVYSGDYFANLEKADDVEFPRNERILKQIEKFQPKKGLILDVGVGSGLFLKLAIKSSWRVCGIDISEYAIKKVKKEITGDFEMGQLSQVSWKKQSFDAINMRHTIEHVQNPHADLKKAYWLLKPGGVIVIATPNSYGLHAKLFGKLWPHWSLPYHLHFFSKESLKKAIQGAGFEIVTVKTEELTNYDPLKLLLYKLGVKRGYNSVTSLSFFINIILAKMGLGEGLLIIAKKPKNEK